MELLIPDLEGLTRAASHIAKGAVICYPTDTVYGLGCNPLDYHAVEKVLKIKGGREKPMPVLVRSVEDAVKLARIPEPALRLARRYWPGPLTIIVPAKPILPSNLIPTGTVGLRSPNHPICLGLLELCSGYLVGTSANLSGMPPATTAQEAVKELSGKVDIILDGGRTPLGVASTVVDMSEEHPTIVREGPIGIEAILKCIQRGS